MSVAAQNFAEHTNSTAIQSFSPTGANQWEQAGFASESASCRKDSQAPSALRIGATALLAFNPSAVDLPIQAPFNNVAPSDWTWMDDEGNAYATTPQTSLLGKSVIEEQVRYALTLAQQEDEVNKVVETSSSKLLNRLIALGGYQTIIAIEETLPILEKYEDALTGVIRILGKTNNQNTKIDRLKILVAYLNHKSPIIRDASALALVDLSEKGAIKYIKDAIKTEVFASVTECFELAIEEIESA